MDRRAITWDSAGWLFPVISGAALAALAVVVLGRADLVVFAAPLIGALAGAWFTAAPSPDLRVEASLSVDRVFEGDTVTLNVRIVPPPGVEILEVTLEAGPELSARSLSWESAAELATGAWELQTVRWGRAQSRLDIEVRGSGGMMVGRIHYELPAVSIYPIAAALQSVPRPTELPDLLGVHLGRRRGEGVEFAGIREYQPGDQLRSVNWPVTARRGRLHVTERLTEQAAKVVVVVDASLDLRQPGGSSLELSVHGALAVVEAALRRGDRAGVVALGGIIRWTAPGLGRRHLFRVLEALADVQTGTGSAPADFGGFPRSVLPPGAAVVVFSPLVDDRVVGAVADLRRRGFGIVVVDVLRTEPVARPDSDYDPIAVRMWRIGRRGVRYRLAQLGIPVGLWSEGTELEEVLRPMAQRPLIGPRR